MALFLGNPCILHDSLKNKTIMFRYFSDEQFYQGER